MKLTGLESASILHDKIMKLLQSSIAIIFPSSERIKELEWSEATGPESYLCPNCFYALFTNRILSVCAPPPPPPPVRYAPPVTDHVPLHSKSLFKNMAGASGWRKWYAPTKMGGGAQTEKIRLLKMWFKTNNDKFFNSFYLSLVFRFA